MKKIFAIVIFLMAIHHQAQQFSGEIFLRDTSSMYLNQVYVTNLTEQKTILTNYAGNFSITAKAGDIIRFTSIATERKDVTITENMLGHPHNMVELKVAYYEIQEIIISKFRPTGNLRQDVLSLKADNKVEKLKAMIGLPEAKGDGNPPHIPVVSLANGGLSFSIDSMYDLISGERKKKERLQNYEVMMKGITNMKSYFGTEYFTKLRIPENLIDNFLQFIYSSDNLQPMLAAGNYEATKIYIERYLPVYHRRLRSSQMMEVTSK